MTAPSLPPRRSRRARNGTVQRLERKSGSRFAVWYWVDDERRRELQPAGITERQARGRLSELMESGRRGELPRGGGSVPFDKYATAWLSERESLVRAGSLKASTYRDNETAVNRHLTPFYGDLPLDELTRADCLAFRAHTLGQGTLAPKTINGLLGTLKLILAHAVDQELLVASPAASVKRLATGQREMEWYEVGEAERLVKHTPPEWRALIALAAFAGLRQGEILALRWSDVQWSSDRLHVRQSLQRRQKLLDQDA
jgi:integrase